MIYELVIIGGGPAGSAGAVYAARKQLKTLLLVKEFGGQSVVSPNIFNWIGTTSISGADLAKNLENHVRQYEGEYLSIEIDEVEKVEKKDSHFLIQTKNGKSFESKTILVTAGSSRRKLSVPGADALEHKGLTYCASCDGPIFAGADVLVIGGGNAGFETAAQLLAYTKSVTLLNRSDKFKADPITVEKVLAHENMTAILNADIQEVHGDKFVDGATYIDTLSGETKKLNATGIFVEIGQIPNTGFIKDVVELDQYGRIEIDPWTQASKTPGIWAAGDCTNIKYHQNNIAAGDAVRATEDIYISLRAK